MAFEELSRRWAWIRARMLEGTFPGDQATGIWPINGNRISKGWGAVFEKDWPQAANEPWPPVIPSGLDALAKKNRWDTAQRCTSIDECKYVIASQKGLVNLAVEITPDWHNPINGQIPLPDGRDVIAGSHSISLLGYDDDSRLFQFRNSWGVEWGNKGYGALPYEYFDSRLIEALALHPNLNRNLPQNRGVVDLVPNRISLFPATRFHQHEIYDSDKDEMIAWSFTTEYERSCTVEEVYVRPDYRRRGYGTRLLKWIHGLSLRLRKSYQFHITYADIESANISSFAKRLMEFDYIVKPSRLRWSPLVGVKRKKKESFNLAPLVAYIPERPASVRHKLAALLTGTSLTQSTVIPVGSNAEPQEAAANLIVARADYDWAIQNERRIHLLGLKHSTGQSPAESEELARLQEESLRRIQEAFPIPDQDRDKLRKLQSLLNKLKGG